MIVAHSPRWIERAIAGLRRRPLRKTSWATAIVGTLLGKTYIFNVSFLAKCVIFAFYPAT
jgi:hypothetical protein